MALFGQACGGERGPAGGVFVHPPFGVGAALDLGRMRRIAARVSPVTMRGPPVKSPCSAVSDHRVAHVGVAGDLPV